LEKMTSFASKTNMADRTSQLHDFTPLQGRKMMNESEERFKLLFERSAYPTLLMEGDRFIDCNEAALKALHCTAKEQVM